LAYATVGLIVVAAIQVWLFVWQLGYMRTGLHDAKVAAEAAGVSADAAKKAAEALPKLERAYVFFNSATSEDITASRTLGGIKPTIFRVNYSFENHGRTAAILISIKMNAAYVASGFPNIADALPGDIPTYLIVGSGEGPPRLIPL
jgi:hypothetical protein